jgi:hypothetical protein
MTTGLPAWVAICAVLTVQMVPARADDPPDTLPERPSGEGEPTRHVAVIDLSADDTEARKLTQSLYETISQSDVLRAPNTRELDAYLVGPLFDEDAGHISLATNHLSTADASLAAGDAANALTQARFGEAELARVTPTIQVRSLYADLSLAVGLSFLDQGRTQDAVLAFGLTHRLDPTRKLDDVRYPPDTVATFNRATDTKPKLITLDIKGSGHIWVDCTDRGAAPATLTNIEAGEHVVTLTGPERQTTAVQPIEVPDKKDPTVMIVPAPVIAAATTFEVPERKADDAVKVQRARLALARAQTANDDVGRAGAMKQLATLLHVTDAIMISKRADKKLQWETWRDRAPGFGAPKIFTNQKPEVIIVGLAPPHRPLALRASALQPFTPPAIPEQQWYEKGWVQISGAGGVILVIAGIILVATRERAINWGTDIKASD